jgi:hypothetical protein
MAPFIIQVNLELIILLPQSPKCWDYRLKTFLIMLLGYFYC